MRENRLKRLWAESQAAVNGWCAVPSSFSAEIMAHQGWDSLTIDLQHGLVDYQAAIPMLQAISTTDTVPMVRVPWLDSGILMKMLDAGAYGVICPMISSGEEAERLVAACRYPPLGGRSFGPIRASLYAGADYPAHANNTVAVFAMIETRQALDNLDDIVAVEGLDGLYIGPSDLSSALGYKPGFDRTEPELVEAIDLVLAKTKERNLVAGIHNGSVAYARSMIEKGFQLVTVGSDARFIAAGAAETVAEIRG
ncbi:MAG TPA: aldolase/citrate lyase family protein [Kiloniellales bacterium]|jgi:4-hydroxy-2-oxoheptanedioate aldolase|nr:aldolase/citrate lyase family protein [Kiloniellales bacterium]